MTVSAIDLSEAPILAQSTASLPTALLPSAGGRSLPSTPAQTTRSSEAQDMVRVGFGVESRGNEEQSERASGRVLERSRAKLLQHGCVYHR